MDASWPATLLTHGTADTAVFPEESYRLHSLLENARVLTVLLKIPEQNHLFNFAPNAEECYGKD
jgi:dipeptidyl aminopeptidase/acylaminoacyl peptidase